MKKIFSIIFVIVLMIFSFACNKTNDRELSNTPIDSLEATESKLSETLKEETIETEYNDQDALVVYVLGDSIAYGETITRKEDVFGFIFTQMINGKIINKAHSGDNSNNLYKKILELDDLDSADIILISIGANDILISLIYNFSLIFNDLLVAYSNKDNEKIINLIVSFQNSITETTYYSALTKSIDLLENKYNQIFDELNKKNDHAEIYIETIYNPYVGFHYENGENTINIDELSNELVSRINEIIKKVVKSRQDNGDKIWVVDVYEAFKNEEDDCVNANFSFVASEFRFDPHPNKFGHIVIANEYYKIYQENSTLMK